LSLKKKHNWIVFFCLIFNVIMFLRMDDTE
jgi:hypothetical protein